MLVHGRNRCQECHPRAHDLCKRIIVNIFKLVYATFEIKLSLSRWPLTPGGRVAFFFVSWHSTPAITYAISLPMHPATVSCWYRAASQRWHGAQVINLNWEEPYRYRTIGSGVSCFRSGFFFCSLLALPPFVPFRHLSVRPYIDLKLAYATRGPHRRMSNRIRPTKKKRVRECVYADFWVVGKPG